MDTIKLLVGTLAHTFKSSKPIKHALSKLKELYLLSMLLNGLENFEKFLMNLL